AGVPTPARTASERGPQGGPGARSRRFVEPRRHGGGGRPDWVSWRRDGWSPGRERRVRAGRRAPARPTDRELGGRCQVSGRTPKREAIGVSASPAPGSRSRRLVARTLGHLAGAGFGTELLDLSDLPADALLARRRDSAA